MMMDATKQMLDEVRKVKTKLAEEKTAFDNAMEIVGIKTESEIDLFGPDAVSRVADVASAVRKASDRLYTACQTQIPLLDARCRGLLDQNPSTRAVKEVTALIEELNRESEISTNFRGNINGGTFYDLVGVRYIPSLENQVIQRFWESRYSEMPGTAEEDKAYAEREEKERREQTVIKHQAKWDVLREEQRREEQKKQAEEQERQERLARIAENNAAIKARREYLQRAREMVGGCGTAFAWVKADGSVESTHQMGDPSAFWGIRSVVCTEDGVVGLRHSGACMATAVSGDCQSRLQDVENWSGIVALAAGVYHVVGLRKNGTCAATSFKRDAHLRNRGQSDVASWTDIQAIACGREFTVGLKKDGTLVYAGPDAWNGDGRITKLKDIDQIAAGGSSFIALTKTGEIRQVGTLEQGAVAKAENVVQLAVVDSYPYALQADGTLLGGREDPFRRDTPMVIDRGVVALYGENGNDRVLRYLREDGTLIEKRSYDNRGKPALDQRLFESYDAHWQELEDAEQARKAKVQQILAWREAGKCQYCGGDFKRGLFGQKCSGCGKKKDY